MTGTQTTEDHPRIWLEPTPPAGVFEGRTWCQVDVWSDNAEYDCELPTEYVRADLVAARDAEIKRLRGAVKNAHEHGGNCYADTLRLPHCDAGYCQCGRAPQ